jgi:hypothetical protein
VQASHTAVHKVVLLLDAVPMRQVCFRVIVLDERQFGLNMPIAFCRSKLARKRYAKCG